MWCTDGTTGNSCSDFANAGWKRAEARRYGSMCAML